MHLRSTCRGWALSPPVNVLCTMALPVAWLVFPGNTGNLPRPPPGNLGVGQGGKGCPLGLREGQYTGEGHPLAGECLAPATGSVSVHLPGHVHSGGVSLLCLYRPVAGGDRGNKATPLPTL